jgi:hypothetical protein
MDADTIATLRAQARSTGGSFIKLDEPGEWFAGTVAGFQTVTTDYGDAEELILTDVTINGDPADGERTFRLSRWVLRAELGKDAEKDAPDTGWSVYVVYRGQRTSKGGKAYHAYDIAKKAPASEDAVTAAKAALQQFDAQPVAGAGDADIPF